MFGARQASRLWCRERQGARLVSALIGSKVQLCFGWEYSRGFTGFKQGYRGRTNAPEFQGIYFIYSIYVYAWYIPLYSYIYIYIYIYIIYILHRLYVCMYIYIYIYMRNSWKPHIGQKALRGGGEGGQASKFTSGRKLDPKIPKPHGLGFRVLG